MNRKRMKIQAIYIYLFFLLTGSALSSCQQEELVDATKGGFRISLSDTTVGVETKADADTDALPEEVLSKFHLCITNEGTGQVIYDAGYTSETIKAAEGSYKMNAVFGTNPLLGWDPYYVGEATNQKVESGQTTSVEVKCALGNALASVVVWPDAEVMEKVFDEYGIKVVVENKSVVLKPEGSSPAYFQPGKKVNFYFVGKLKGHTESITPQLLESEEFPDSFQAKDHCKLTLKIQDDLSLSVEKAEIETEAIHTTIPLEWLPEPKVMVSGFVNNSLSFYETESPDAAIGLMLSSGLQEMKFKLDLQDERFKGLSGEYTLSQISEEKRKELTDSGLSLPELGDKGTVGFVGPDFITSLYSVNEGTPVTNTITITEVKANDRTISPTETYMLEVKKPEFSIAVQDYNIWSKQFTIDECDIVSGDEQKLRAGLKYQYRLKGENDWKDCSDDNAHVFQTSQPSTLEFETRAIYRDALISNIANGALEEERQVPNGNMDAWTASTREAKVSGIESYQQPYFQPWDTSVEHWWDTNSNKTMPKSITSCLLNKDKLPNVKSFPTITYRDLEAGNREAIIRTISVNNANISSTSLGENIRGILYAGETDDSGNMKEGRSFLSRPSGLSFRYKYSSYDNERFGVYIELYNEDTKIANGSFLSVNGISVDSYAQGTLKLSYVDESLKATSIRIRFCSVAEGDSPAIEIGKTVFLPTGNRNAHAGSELYINDISLIYDK